MSGRLNYPKLSYPAYQALLAMEKTLEDSTLERALMNLVRVRVSQLNGCLFSLDLHSKEARKRGERELRLYHLTLWPESELYTHREKAGLRWADLLTHIDPNGVEEEDYGQALEFFTEKELSDLTFLIGVINTWNRLGIAFRVDPGSMDKVLGVDKLTLV